MDQGSISTVQPTSGLITPIVYILLMTILEQTGRVVQQRLYGIQSQNLAGKQGIINRPFLTPMYRSGNSDLKTNKCKEVLNCFDG